MKTYQNVSEGGDATAQWGTVRANQSDVKSALATTSQALGIPVSILSGNLLGSTELTLLGKQPDSGDIDIAFKKSDSDMATLNQKMLDVTNGRGKLSAGLGVGSYAVETTPGRYVQVDLMFVDNTDWAKFMYHSEFGAGSEYKGVVRNLILEAVVRHSNQVGDIVVKDAEGNLIARGSMGIDSNKGMKRIFKVALVNKRTGARNKTLTAVTPAELKAELVAIDPKYGSPEIEYSDKLIDDSSKITEILFGVGVLPADISSAEKLIDVIATSSKIPVRQKSAITHDAILTLERRGLPIPPALLKLK
jgi:hypothetical protein